MTNDMKTFHRILSFLAAILSAGLFFGCTQTMDEIGTLELRRCLEPMNLSAKVTNGDQVTFNWDVTKDATQYNLVVYTDKEMTKEYFSTTLDPSQVPFTKALEADATYYYKVRAFKKSGSKHVARGSHVGLATLQPHAQFFKLLARKTLPLLGTKEQCNRPCGILRAGSRKHIGKQAVLYLAPRIHALWIAHLHRRLDGASMLPRGAVIARAPVAEGLFVQRGALVAVHTRLGLAQER